MHFWLELSNGIELRIIATNVQITRDKSRTVNLPWVKNYDTFNWLLLILVEMM